MVHSRVIRDPEIRSGRHFQNISKTRDQDIIIASYGGCGHSMLANVLLHARLPYVNPAVDVMHDDGRWEPDSSTDAYRQRFSGNVTKRPVWRPGQQRFVKTHLLPEEFDAVDYLGVWLLVRDPRDALKSWHRFRREFVEPEWEKLHCSFEEYLSRRDYTGNFPLEEWDWFYRGWLQRGQQRGRVHITRFEDVKRDPMTILASALDYWGVQYNDGELGFAIEESTFDNMHSHEGQAALQDSGREGVRVMHKGAVNGWREWMTPSLARYFDDAHVRTTASQFGYAL